MTPDEVRERYVRNEDFFLDIGLPGGEGLGVDVRRSGGEAGERYVAKALHAIIADATQAQQERIKELEAIIELSDELAYATGALICNDGTPRDPKGR